MLRKTNHFSLSWSKYTKFIITQKLRLKVIYSEANWFVDVLHLLKNPGCRVDVVHIRSEHHAIILSRDSFEKPLF